MNLFAMTSLGILFIMSGIIASEESYSGFQLSIREDILVNKNIKFLQESVELLKRVEYPPTMWLNETVWSFTFATRISNFKLVEITDNFTSPTHSLNEDILKVTIPKAINMDYEFSFDITISGLHFISGTGKASIITDVLELTQELNRQYPPTAIKAEFKAKTLSLKTGIIGSLFSDSIAKLIKGELNLVIFPLMSNSLKILENNIAPKILYDLMEYKIQLPDREIKIMTDVKNSFTQDLNGVKYQVFLLSGRSISDQVVCTEFVTSTSPYTPVANLATKQLLCFHFGAFPAGVNADSICAKYTEDVILSEWGLAGRASEMFEILPELAFKYNSNDKYRIVRDLLFPSVANPESNKLVVTKYYSFIMERTGEEVLVVEADYAMELEMVFEISELKGIQRKVFVQEMRPNKQIRPIPKSTLMRYMNREIKKMNDLPLIPGGIKIPQGSVASRIVTETTICFDY